MLIKRFFFFIALCLLPLSIFGTKLNSDPFKIVSLSPTMTEILFAIEAQNVVGVTSYCNYPEAATALPKIGDLSINLESVISLEPDKILGLDGDRSLIPKLRQMGANVKIFHSPTSIDETLQMIYEVGAFVEELGKAVELVKAMQATIQTLQNNRPKKRFKFMIVVWQDPLMVANSNTFISDLAVLAGGINVVDEPLVAFPKINPEFLLKSDPDVIIFTQPNLTFTPEQKTFLSLREDGSHRKLIPTINPDLLVRAGPRFLEGVMAIKKAIKSPNK